MLYSYHKQSTLFHLMHKDIKAKTDFDYIVATAKMLKWQCMLYEMGASHFKSVSLG